MEQARTDKSEAEEKSYAYTRKAAPPPGVTHRCEVTCPHTHPPAEAAELIGISESALRKGAAARTFPSTLIAGRLSFSDDNLAAIIAAGDRQPIARRTARRR
ncbi:hypothetical protein [Actinomadura miaoliensis]|uniref:DNA-binding protein n=1 Tax=Actinomadura miaoliensis TaxID=430685 RepID=A0ABP7WAW4_9ACTN